MSTHYGNFIVDGTHYTCLPRSFNPLQEHLVRSQYLPLVEGRSLCVIDSAKTKDTNDYTQKRRVQIQAWNSAWDENGTHATVQLRNQLYDLYTTQKSVWIQLDDEMSRCYGRCVAAGFEYRLSDKPKPYFTPTYPIYPYGFEVGDTPDWTGMLIVGTDIYSDAFTVDSNTGLVLIDSSTRTIFLPSTLVYLKYTWMAHVRVAALDLNPSEIDQQYYIGSAIFEQVS